MRKITDHSSWIGSGADYCPMGTKNKMMESGPCAGQPDSYGDTAEAIKGEQDMQASRSNAKKADPKMRH